MDFHVPHLFLKHLFDDCTQSTINCFNIIESNENSQNALKQIAFLFQFFFATILIILTVFTSDTQACSAKCWTEFQQCQKKCKHESGRAQCMKGCDEALDKCIDLDCPPLPNP